MRRAAPLLVALVGGGLIGGGCFIVDSDLSDACLDNTLTVSGNLLVGNGSLGFDTNLDGSFDPDLDFVRGESCVTFARVELKSGSCTIEIDTASAAPVAGQLYINSVRVDASSSGCPDWGLDGIYSADRSSAGTELGTVQFPGRIDEDFADCYVGDMVVALNGFNLSDSSGRVLEVSRSSVTLNGDFAATSSGSSCVVPG